MSEERDWVKLYDETRDERARIRMLETRYPVVAAIVSEKDAEIAALREVLVKVEWVNGRCSCCWSWKHEGHADNCDLARLLHTEKEA